MDSALKTLLDDREAMRAAFDAQHRERFGFAVQDRPVMVQTLSVEGVAVVSAMTDAPSSEAAETGPASPVRVRVHIDGGDREIEVHDRESLTRHSVIAGPGDHSRAQRDDGH